MPWWAWLTLFVARRGAAAGRLRRAATSAASRFDTVLYMLLALGLNVVVGWGGLLDLGYVAFYGVGAYTYAFLSSDLFGIPPADAASRSRSWSCIGGIVGLLVGLPSRRLVGDYLAIVTLFFLQIFLTFTTNGDNVFGHNITGGANGILNVDPLGFFGHDLPVEHEGIFDVSYLYVALAFFAVVSSRSASSTISRTGRAWRSLREDSLAAELMGMPVNWLKLMASPSARRSRRSPARCSRR